MRRRWLRGGDSAAAIAREGGVSPATLRRRAAAEGWGKPGDGADRVGRAMRLYAELGDALGAAIATLKDSPESDEPSQAKARAELVRAHRRALAAVIEAEAAAPDKESHDKDAARGGGLDLAAARRDVMGRLARLAGRGGADGVFG